MHASFNFGRKEPPAPLLQDCPLSAGMGKRLSGIGEDCPCAPSRVHVVYGCLSVGHLRRRRPHSRRAARRSADEAARRSPRSVPVLRAKGFGRLLSGLQGDRCAESAPRSAQGRSKRAAATGIVALICAGPGGRLPAEEHRGARRPAEGLL